MIEVPLVKLFSNDCQRASLIISRYWSRSWLGAIREQTITYINVDLNICLLTHWGRVTHICIGKLTITGSDNGLSPERHQAIIWTSAGALLIGPLGTNFSEMLFRIQIFSFKKMHLKMSSAKWHPFCTSLNELNGTTRPQYVKPLVSFYYQGLFEFWVWINY